jgi:hypothetical protein
VVMRSLTVASFVGTFVSRDRSWHSSRRFPIGQLAHLSNLQDLGCGAAPS